MGVSLLILILVPIIGVFLLLTLRRSKKPMSSIQFNKKTTFKIVFVFTTLLVFLTILSEFAISRAPAVTFPPIADAQLEERHFELGEKIMNGEQVDDSFLLKKRIHDIGDSLILKQIGDSFDLSAYFYIERKKEDDSTVEERIYKPLFIVDQYDFSEVMNVQLPIWDGNIVTFPPIASTEKIRYTSFTEALTLEQFTKTTINHAQIDSWPSSISSSVLIIHLIVPEDVEIIADDNEYVIYIDEDEW